jgi:plasmid stability protein
MATITVRNLDDEVQRRIKLRATQNNRSMEAETRAILTAAVIQPEFAAHWIDATAPFRGDGVPIPMRSAPREVDLS